MTVSLPALTAIALMALATLATRFAGATIMRRIGLSPRVERFLEALSVSVIAALVASALAQGGMREAAAVAVAAIVMLTWGSAARAMLAGMAAAALWTALEL